MKKTILCSSYNSQFSRDLEQRYNKKYNLFFMSRKKNTYKKNIFFYSNFLEMKKIIIKINPDIIWHNMGISQQKISFLDPSLTLKVNFISSVEIIEIIKNLKKKITLIFFSSSAVYSQKISRKISETDEIIPTSPYSFSKLYSEDYIKYFSRLYKFNYIILRPFQVISDFKKNGLIFDLKKKISKNLKSKDRIIVGDIAKIKRDFLHVSVANDMILSLIEKKSFNQTFNLCSSKGISIFKIFSYLIQKYNKNINYLVDKSYNNKFENNIRIGNNTKLLNCLRHCKKSELNIFNYL